MNRILPIFTLCFALALALPAFSQTVETDEVELPPFDPNKKKRLGIKGGAAFTTVSGGEFINPSIHTGLTGGFFGRMRLNKIFSLQQEINATYRGSRFKNKDDEYSMLSLFYADFPLLLMARTSQKENNDIRLLAGFQPSVLVRSQLFIGKEPIAKFQNLNLKQMDWSAVAGIHYQLNPVSFQILAKVGLSNVNNGLIPADFATTKPQVGNGKEIKNFSLELVVLF